MPRPCHPEVNLEVQEAFKKNFPSLVQQALQTRDSNDTRPVLLLAAYEGRFGRLGQVMRAWCPPGIRPIVSQQIVREYVYAYAAVAPQLGLMTALVLPYANTEMMNLFLEQVSEEFSILGTEKPKIFAIKI